MVKEQQWIVYDERANSVDGTDEAAVLVCESTERQALAWTGRGYVWKYDVDTDGKTLINETFVGPTNELRKNP